MLQGPYLQPVQMMTRQKFAEHVGVSFNVVQNWIARGYIPTIEIGRYSLVNLLALNYRLLDGVFQNKPVELLEEQEGMKSFRGFSTENKG